MTDADLLNWLSESKIDFVREYASRIRYRKLFKVALSRPLVSFEPDAKKKLESMIGNVKALMNTEEKLSEEPGSVVLDVIIPELGENKLRKIPLLVGGECGYDLVSLDETKEGRPLVHTLKQQTKTIPSVRVYCDPEIASLVRKRFDEEFPMTDILSYREDEHDLTEC